MIEILEYTRAFLKKTWRLANQGKQDESDRTKQVAIAVDIEYAGENLELIREDPRYGFDGTDIKAINGVLDDYELARMELLAHHVGEAIPPEKSACRTLRRLVDDVVQQDVGGGGNSANKDKPDKVELKDVQHLTRLERERVANQLKTLKQRLGEVAREQEKLSRTFMHFLDDPQKQEKRSKVNDEKSWFTEASQSDQSNQTDRQNQQGSASGGPKQDRTVEGALAPPSGPKSGSLPANFAEIMKVLKAQQQQLRTELSMLEDQLAQIPIGLNTDRNRSNPIESRKEARAHIEQAKGGMDRFEAYLEEQYYDRQDPNQLALEAPPMLGAISRELMMTRQAILKEVGSYMDDEKERLRQLALNLQEMADAYDKALTPEQRQQLLNSMVAAMGQLDSMAATGPPDNTNVGGERSGRSTGPVLTVNSDYREIIEAAQFTARQFLSKYIEVTQRTDTRVGKDDGGSLKFYEQENDFFESAAESRPR